jgi:hypothetical protein
VQTSVLSTAMKERGGGYGSIPTPGVRATGRQSDRPQRQQPCSPQTAPAITQHMDAGLCGPACAHLGSGPHTQNDSCLSTNRDAASSVRARMKALIGAPVDVHLATTSPATRSARFPRYAEAAPQYCPPQKVLSLANDIHWQLSCVRDTDRCIKALLQEITQWPRSWPTFAQGSRKKTSPSL